MTIFKKPSKQREVFLNTAGEHLGYKCRPGGLSEFAIRTGYKGELIPWSGAFIDCVARDSGIFMPSCVYTPSGLGEFIADGRLRTRPEPGDIVFYNFPTGPQFGMPHVGIVAWVDEFMQTGTFRAIEAQINSGLPKASNDKTGVFERTRHKYDVIAFARPDFERRPGIDKKVQTGGLLIKSRNVRPGRKHSHVEIVQRALVQVCDLSMHTAGEFDARTTQAYSRWQRMIGYVHPDCTGTPDDSSLHVLGTYTGLFNVEGEI